jgi:hypothetical protein
MAEELDDLDEDQEYCPDPTALRVAARVIQRRAALAPEDAETAAELIEYAADFCELAAMLEGRPDSVPAPDALNCPIDAGATGRPSMLFMETTDFVGFVRSAPLTALGLELRSFRLAPQDAASPREAPPVAVVELIGRPDEGWEILHAEVDPSRRRKGLATRLYDRIEEVLATTLRPSGWLSEDAYAFWRSRSPDAVAGHRRVEPFLHLWISPGQLLNLMTIDRSKLEAWLESAREDAAEDADEAIETTPRRLN